MKFMVMHKHDRQSEAGIAPPPEFVGKMGGLVGGMAQSGKLLDGDGRGASVKRSRVTFQDGEPSVVHGPFAGSNELPAGFVKVSVRSRDEAIEIAKRVGEAIGGNLEIEVGKCQEAWDLGFGETPADAPERYLVIHKATPDRKLAAHRTWTRSPRISAKKGCSRVLRASPRRRRRSVSPGVGASIASGTGRSPNRRR